ncbi:hypothetical protein KQX54_010096 [Cotesia glomerata]|uniref:THAP-type domain-containing protein n=1 Tax=Cotesia glomerata TaxID=32391 RepID=A0AAV7I2N9_COTGL|nr:hypothetical protein KQX54_010096 [Cotesia glomerata]
MSRKYRKDFSSQLATRLQLDSGGLVLATIAHNADRLRKWSLALSQNLTPDKFVCELHFSDDDIIKKDMIPILNQDCYISSRKKYTLKPNVIPRVDRIPNIVEDANLQIDPDDVLPAARTPEVETSSIAPDVNEVTNLKTNESTNVQFTLLGNEDFWDLLKELETINSCDGTGFDSNRCSVSCKNLLSNENQRYYQGIIRCQPCRTLRRQLQNRDSKSTQNLKIQYDMLKRELISQKRKTSRLKRKNNELSQLIEDQKLKCAAVEAEIIEKAIADLPEIQQKAVRACFDAAKSFDINILRLQPIKRYCR